MSNGYEGFDEEFLAKYQRKRGAGSVKVTSGPELSANINNPSVWNEPSSNGNSPHLQSDTSKEKINPFASNETLHLTNPYITIDNPQGGIKPHTSNDQSTLVTNPSKSNDKPKKNSNPLLATRNKNNAVPTTIDGIRFASKWEAETYLNLKSRQQAGEFPALLLQVPILLPGMTETGKQRNRMNVDFMIIHDLSAVEFIDAKGKTERDWHLRKCMAEHEYGIEIRVVKRQKRTKS